MIMGDYEDHLALYDAQWAGDNGALFDENVPMFEHDCDTCVFLGTYKDRDLWFHPAPMESIGNMDESMWFVTLISRYGVDGEYCSGTVANQWGREAFWRAMKVADPWNQRVLTELFAQEFKSDWRRFQHWFWPEHA